MRVARTKGEVREAVAVARREGRRVGLVPTMGYLHEGHLSLLDRAKKSADWVGLSIFVNPLQFGPAEDLDRYPRDLERDLEQAAGQGVDLVFAPSVSEMYPAGPPRVAVVPEVGADVLCGARRPGHFRGVLTVVAKLLGIFAPDVAVFGRKDYQQVVLIRRMVEDLDLPVEVVTAPIVREADGVAMSSRNVYLSPDERVRARSISGALRAVKDGFRAGERDPNVLRGVLVDGLGASGLRLEYAELLAPDSLEVAETVEEGSVCAVAAMIGQTRLIDNAVLTLSAEAEAP
jgi:pantoate--beta-alanine ligase